MIDGVVFASGYQANVTVLLLAPIEDDAIEEDVLVAVSAQMDIANASAVAAAAAPQDFFKYTGALLGAEVFITSYVALVEAGTQPLLTTQT